jgi:hypothetical protein
VAIIALTQGAFDQITSRIPGGGRTLPWHSEELDEAFVNPIIVRPAAHRRANNADIPNLPARRGVTKLGAFRSECKMKRG